MTRIARYATRVTRRVGRVHPRPVLVLGNQKSGTSAIAALTAARAGVAATVDIPGLWPHQHGLYEGRVPLARIVRANRRDFSRPVIKEPGLTFLVPQLRQLFPEGQLVLVLRDPRDNLRSALDRLGLRGGRDDDLAADDLPAGWSRAFDQRALGIDHPHPIGRLALRWRLAAMVGREPDVTVVRYEDFVADKLGTIDRLVEQLGWSPVQSIEARLDEPFQPGRRQEVDREAFFGPDNLRLIEDLCRDLMHEYGYLPLPTTS